MTEKTFCISGRVIDRKTRRGDAGLRVEAWDKDVRRNDMVGSVITDAQGAFLIKFDESYYKDHPQESLPDLFFKVFRKDELIQSTEDTVLWNLETKILNCHWGECHNARRY